ncbi:MAG TPA: hypothetical protein DIC60_01280 [Lachnospiraceae bacterium]|nr:hypothetical protein [Lachnospiraceae bacterium]
MEETVIVIMLKDSKTGFLEKELGCYKITEDENLIYNTYAVEDGEKTKVFMKLTTDREVEDWEFEAIYDYYDNETISPFVTSIEEDTECYNPTWCITFDFVSNIEEMEEKIGRILKLHKQELQSVYEAIADKRDEY